MKVAVIGAGGFVGSRVAGILAGDPAIELSLLDRLAFPHPESPRVKAVVGDFADPAVRQKALDGANKVILLAAILGGAAEADYALARRVNVDATLGLFEFLRDPGAPGPGSSLPRRSPSIPQPLPDPVTDATALGPTMVYGAQKLMMEVALSNFAVRGRLDGVSLRPSGVMARDGADAALKTAFMSRLFWCVKRGENIASPIAPESPDVADLDRNGRAELHPRGDAAGDRTWPCIHAPRSVADLRTVGRCAEAAFPEQFVPDRVRARTGDRRPLRKLPAPRDGDCRTAWLSARRNRGCAGRARPFR